MSLGGDYGGGRQACGSTNCNRPSGTDDAMIALSVRTLGIASEGDTSLQSGRRAGKSAGFPGIWFIREACTSAIQHSLPLVVFSESSTTHRQVVGGFHSNGVFRLPQDNPTLVRKPNADNG